MPNLFLFTQHYPFRPGAESFIENEIWVASKFFEHIYIVPVIQDGEIREIPANASVINPPFKTNKDILKKGIFGMQPHVIGKLLKEAFILKVWRSKKLLHSYFAQSLEFAALFNSRQLKKIKKIIQLGDILYSYWGTGWGTVIPFSKLNNKFVTRFHRGDLYEEGVNALLFRFQLLNRLDQSIFISKQGQTYQHKKYPNIGFKSQVSYLGTIDRGTTAKNKDGKFRIVSCSHIVPVKRVDLIFRSLVNYDNPEVEWTHIGGRGESLDNLKKLIASTPHNFKVTLTGEMPNIKVMEYFRKNPIDCFINVSSSEGLPVSIMEAISFDIPVIATDVGGTSEIVNNETGILLSSNPSEEEIISAIEHIKKGNFTPRDFWISNFEAITNYNKFYKNLLSMR